MTTLKDIISTIKVAFISSSAVREIYGLETDYQNTNPQNDDDKVAFYEAHISKVSVESVWVFIIATISLTLETMFSWHKQEISDTVDNERYGHIGWYRKKALAFQYGAALNVNYTEIPDANATDGDFSESDEYTVDDDSKKIVEYAHAEEKQGSFGVLLKVAKKVNGIIRPLDNGQNGTDNEITPFTSYMNRIKPAGVPLEIRSTLPDRLILNIRIYYDPLVFDDTGHRLDDNTEPVKAAINGYLNSITFNGEFISMKLIDAIQTVEGVVVAELLSAQYQYASNPISVIDARYTPFAGYMELDMNNDLALTFKNNYGTI